MGTRTRHVHLNSHPNDRKNSTDSDAKVERKSSYESALMRTCAWKNEKKGTDDGFEYTAEEEWRIVATTIDRCFFVFFTLLFFVACWGCFCGTRYVAWTTQHIK